MASLSSVILKLFNKGRPVLPPMLPLETQPCLLDRYHIHVILSESESKIFTGIGGTVKLKDRDMGKWLSSYRLFSRPWIFTNHTSHIEANIYIHHAHRELKIVYFAVYFESHPFIPSFPHWTLTRFFLKVRCWKTAITSAVLLKTISIHCLIFAGIC